MVLIVSDISVTTKLQDAIKKTDELSENLLNFLSNATVIYTTAVFRILAIIICIEEFRSCVETIRGKPVIL